MTPESTSSLKDNESFQDGYGRTICVSTEEEHYRLRTVGQELCSSFLADEDQAG
jgi:hypothetical protein